MEYSEVCDTNIPNYFVYVNNRLTPSFLPYLH